MPKINIECVYKWFLLKTFIQIQNTIKPNVSAIFYYTLIEQGNYSFKMNKEVWFKYHYIVITTSIPMWFFTKTSQKNDIFILWSRYRCKAIKGSKIWLYLWCMKLFNWIMNENANTWNSIHQIKLDHFSYSYLAASKSTRWEWTSSKAHQ